MKKAKKHLYIIYVKVLKGLLVTIGLRKSNLSKFMDSIIFELRMFLFILLILIGMSLFLLITDDLTLTLSNFVLKLNTLLILLIGILMMRVLLKFKLYKINSCLNNNQPNCGCNIKTENLDNIPKINKVNDKPDTITTQKDEHDTGSKI